MIRRGTAGHRHGLTLLEVLLALAIFLLSLAAITQLVSTAGKRALDARRTAEGARLARSKFAEVFAGVVPLQSQDDTPFDEDPDYTWSVTANSASISDLWFVSVTVKHKGDEGAGITLSEFVLDPTVRGSTQDTVTITGTPSSSSGSGSSPSQSSSPAAAGKTAAKASPKAEPASAAKAPSMPARTTTPTPSPKSSPSPTPSPRSSSSMR